MKIPGYIMRKLERNLVMFEELDDLRQQRANLLGEDRRRILEGSQEERIETVLFNAILTHKDILSDQIIIANNTLERDREEKNHEIRNEF